MTDRPVKRGPGRPSKKKDREDNEKTIALRTRAGVVHKAGEQDIDLNMPVELVIVPADDDDDDPDGSEERPFWTIAFRPVTPTKEPSMVELIIGRLRHFFGRRAR